jgi:uncharacterized circularly permuted ATP-grasp superfamily protein
MMDLNGIKNVIKIDSLMKINLAKKAEKENDQKSIGILDRGKNTRVENCYFETDIGILSEGEDLVSKDNQFNSSNKGEN